MAYSGAYTGAQVDEGIRKGLQLPEIKGEVANFAALPGSPSSGDIWLAIAAQGVYLVNRKPAGFYRYSGAAWVFMGTSIASIGTEVLDEDDMSSNSATATATQQSVKAYSDSATQTLTNKTLTSPTLTTPVLGTPSSGNLGSCTAYPGDSSLVTTGALNSGSITSGFGAIDNGASNITTTGDVSGGTLNATSDTSVADASALGYTAAEGAILTGQGSTSDVTLKNDADGTVLTIPTGTTNIDVVGTVEAAAFTDDGVAVPTISSTSTLTNKTIDTASNTITVAEADISDLGSYITASSSDTLTNKTFDANGTGNSLSNVDLTADVTGTLPVASGGTGATTLTDGGVLLGSGTGAVTAMGALADGEMIVGDGTTDPVAESGATLRTSIGVGTGDSPQFTGIELGHASDTTLTRSAAGVLAVEGVDQLAADASNDADGVQFLERADHPNTPAATKGQLWTKNTTPSTLIFTDDAGTDTTLGSGGGGNLTTKGDLEVYTTSQTRLAVGTDDQVLTADSTASEGVAWKTVSNPSGPSELALYIDAAAMATRTTNGAEAATEEYATNDVIVDHFLFDGATEEGVQFKFQLPKDYNGGTVTATFHWDGATGASASDGVTWGLALRTIENDDAIDQAFPSSVDTDDTLIAVGDLHVTASSAAVTIANTPNAGDMVLGEITRVVGDANDTMTEDAKLMAVEVTYDALAATDQYRQVTIPAGMWEAYTTSGAAWTPTVYSSNEFGAFAFDAAGGEAVYIQFRLPEDYLDGSVIRWSVDWDAVATASGTVQWELSGGSFGDSDALSTALGTVRTITDTLLTVGDRHKSDNDATGVTLAGSPVAGDLVTLRLEQTATGTIAVDCLMLSVDLQFERSGVQATAFA